MSEWINPDYRSNFGREASQRREKEADFLADIDAVFRKHGLMLASMDEDGDLCTLEVRDFDETRFWLVAPDMGSEVSR